VTIFALRFIDFKGLFAQAFKNPQSQADNQNAIFYRNQGKPVFGICHS
jgi:hypothetical protein